MHGTRLRAPGNASSVRRSVTMAPDEDRQEDQGYEDEASFHAKDHLHTGHQADPISRNTAEPATPLTFSSRARDTAIPVSLIPCRLIRSGRRSARDYSRRSRRAHLPRRIARDCAHNGCLLSPSASDRRWAQIRPSGGLDEWPPAWPAAMLKGCSGRHGSGLSRLRARSRRLHGNYN